MLQKDFHGNCWRKERVTTLAKRINLKNCHGQRGKIFNEKIPKKQYTWKKYVFPKLTIIKNVCPFLVIYDNKVEINAHILKV